MPSPSDRRRALDALAEKLRLKVLQPVDGAWTPALTGAAKSVTDVWPDTLAQAETELQMAFAAYRPLVEVAVPVTPRDAAVAAVTDAARILGADLMATSSALVAAKGFKTDGEKTTIDAARDTMDRASVELTGWVADFRRFDASVDSSPQPSSDAKLISVVVSGAERIRDGQYYQFFQPGQSVRVRAVTDPDTADAHAALVWHGGEPDFSGAPNLRSLSLATLGEVGRPMTVTATLAGKSLSVQIAVVPEILGFDVKGAFSDGNTTWSVDGDLTGPVVVRALVNPATEAAYRFLAWTGGKPDPDARLDRRLVAPTEIAPGRPLPVEATIRLA